MTVKELIAKLQTMDQNMLVEIESKFNYDDEMIEIASNIYETMDNRVLISTSIL